MALVMLLNSFLLVLRGQSFRGNGSHEYLPLVLNSYARMIVAPLRHAGHAVDVAIAASEEVCEPSSVRRFRQQVESAFGAQTLVSFVVAPTHNQADGMRLAMHVLRGSAARRRYDAYILSRLDLQLRVDVTQWNCSLTDRVNFASICGPRDFDGCVNDVFITLPHAELMAFEAGIGHPAAADCDCESERRRQHGCAPIPFARRCFDD